MRDEIDLREMLQIFWRGKYLILGITAGVVLLTAVYFFLLVPPLYESTALVDLELYGVTGKEMLTLIEQEGLVEEALQGSRDGDSVPPDDISVEAEDEKAPLLQIRAESPDPESCASAVALVGGAIIETTNRYRLDKINGEMEQLERFILYLDDAAEGYLQSRDSRIMELLEEDPVYKGLLGEKASKLVQLSRLDFELKELENPDPDPGLKIRQKAAAALPVHKKLKMALALVLGVMLSVFVLALRHYLAATAPAAEGGPAASQEAKDRSGI